MSLMERRGFVDDLVVGISSRSSSVSTMGSEWDCSLASAGGLVGFPAGVGHRLWMRMLGAVGTVVRICGGLASTLGGGEVGGLLGWFVVGRLADWIVSWRLGRFVGGKTGSSLVGKEGSGVRGLHLLATTVSLSSSSSVRMLKGLLLQVWCWCMSGMFLMILGAVILFDVVATLGGGAFGTLRLGATTLGAGGATGVCHPAKMTVKS